MGQGAKSLAALAALLLALSVVACGADDESDSAANEAGSTEAVNGSPAGAADGGGGSDSGGDRSGSEDAGEFEPRQHDDSGGGSEQYRVKGGDNSVQEFGAEADEDEFAAVTSAFHNFLDARAAQQWGVVCVYLSDAVVASLEKLAEGRENLDSCAGALAQLTNPSAKEALRKESRRADVGSVRIEGERAFVIYTATGDAILTIPMNREDGEWKVASLAGTPLN